jgi:tRNA U38,U39,U40 pseudouridine synthase TruA
MPERTPTPPFLQTRAYPHSEYRSCDSRKYTYFFPSYLLIPPKPGSGLYETFRRQAVPSSNSLANTGAFTDHVHPFWAESPPESSKDDDLQRKHRWRAGPDDVQRLREIAEKFEGTRNFHNFTVGREFGDRSTQRHMKKIEVSYSLKELARTNRRRVDIRPGCPRQRRVDTCYSPWPKFYASPGTWSSQDVDSLLTLSIDRAFAK